MLFALCSGAARAWPCAVPGNLLQNCGFDTDLRGWDLRFGGYTREPVDGASHPGSMTALARLSPESAGLGFRQDVHGLLPDTQYGFGIRARLLNGTVSYCTLFVRRYADVACTVPVPGAPEPAPGLVLSAGWSQATSVFLTGPAAPACARFSVSCTSFGAKLFSLRFDDAFLGVGLVPVELQSFSVE